MTAEPKAGHSLRQHDNTLLEGIGRRRRPDLSGEVVQVREGAKMTELIVAELPDVRDDHVGLRVGGGESWRIER